MRASRPGPTGERRDVTSSRSRVTQCQVGGDSRDGAIPVDVLKAFFFGQETRHRELIGSFFRWFWSESWRAIWETLGRTRLMRFCRQAATSLMILPLLYVVTAVEWFHFVSNSDVDCFRFFGVRITAAHNLNCRSRCLLQGK